MSSRLISRARWITPFFTGLFLFALACDDGPPGNTGGSSGAGGAPDAGCPQDLKPMFTLTIKAIDGLVPPDTSLEVAWSAGTEPIFKLNEPSTWKTLEQGTNVVCDVDSSSPPPEALPALVCRLWVSGAAQILILAKHYQPYADTLVPTMSEECHGPIPSDVTVEILPDVDAGIDSP